MKYLFFIFLFTLRSFGQNAPDKLELIVGDTQYRDVGLFAYVEVSRKGIIEVSFDERMKQWQITGLKPGFVVVAFFTQAHDKSASHKLYVEVDKRSSLGMDTELTEICQMGQISCLNHDRWLKGQVTDGKLFLLAKRLCTKTPQCLFDLQLSPQGREKMERTLKAEFPDPTLQFQISPLGSLTIRSPCQGGANKSLEKSIVALFESLPVYWDCQNKLSDNVMYELQGKVLVMSTSTAQELGLDPLIASISLSQKPHGDLMARIQASVQKQKVEIIAQPNMKLLPYQKSHIHSGSEFYFAGTATKNGQVYPQGEWKEAGVKITAEIQPINADLVYLDFEFFLKTKQPSRENALGSHQLGSRIRLDLDQSIIVGGSEFQHAEEVNDEFILANIPIIGPLFTSESKNTGHYQVFLWLKVSRLGGQI